MCAHRQLASWTAGLTLLFGLLSASPAWGDEDLSGAMDASKWSAFAETLTDGAYLTDLAVDLAAPYQQGIWQAIYPFLGFFFLILLGLSAIGRPVFPNLSPGRLTVMAVLIILVNIPITHHSNMNSVGARLLNDAVPLDAISNYSPSSSGSDSSGGGYDGGSSQIAAGFYYPHMVFKTMHEVMRGSVENTMSKASGVAGIPLSMFSALQGTYASHFRSAPSFAAAYSDYARYCTRAVANNPSVKRGEWRFVGLLGGVPPNVGVGEIEDVAPNALEALKNTYFNSANKRPPRPLRAYRIPTANYWDSRINPESGSSRQVDSLSPDVLSGAVPIPGEDDIYFADSDDYFIPVQSDEDDPIDRSSPGMQYMHFPSNCYDLLKIVQAGSRSYYEAHARYYESHQTLIERYSTEKCEEQAEESWRPRWLTDCSPLENRRRELADNHQHLTARHALNQLHAAGREAVNGGYRVGERGIGDRVVDQARSGITSSSTAISNFFNRWGLETNLPILLGSIGLMYALLTFSFPVLTVIAVFPGREGAIGFAAMVMAWIHLALFLVFVVLKLGGILLSGILFMAANAESPGPNFLRFVSGMGLGLEAGMYVAIASAFYISYMAITGTSHALRGAGGMPMTEGKVLSENLRRAGTAVAAMTILGRGASAAANVVGGVGGGALASRSTSELAGKVSSVAGNAPALPAGTAPRSLPGPGSAAGRALPPPSGGPSGGAPPSTPPTGGRPTTPGSGTGGGGATFSSGSGTGVPSGGDRGGRIIDITPTNRSSDR